MNWIRGFRRIVFCAAIVGGILGMLIGAKGVADISGYERQSLREANYGFIERWGDPIFDEMKKAEAKHDKWFREAQKKPSFDEYMASLDTIEAAIDVRSLPLQHYTTFEGFREGMSDDEIREIVFLKYLADRAEISVLEKSFWASLSGWELVGLCILAGLSGAAVGFAGTWVILWYGSLAGSYMVFVMKSKKTSKGDRSMEIVKYTCPHCKTILEVERFTVERKVQCKECKTMIDLLPPTPKKKLSLKQKRKCLILTSVLIFLFVTLNPSVFRITPSDVFGGSRYVDPYFTRLPMYQYWAVIAVPSVALFYYFKDKNETDKKPKDEQKQ